MLKVLNVRTEDNLYFYSRLVTEPSFPINIYVLILNLVYQWKHSDYEKKIEHQKLKTEKTNMFSFKRLIDVCTNFITALPELQTLKWKALCNRIDIFKSPFYTTITEERKYQLQAVWLSLKLRKQESQVKEKQSRWRQP